MCMYLVRVIRREANKEESDLCSFCLNMMLLLINGEKNETGSDAR